jgi:hypothetical protein
MVIKNDVGHNNSDHKLVYPKGDVLVGVWTL